MRRLVLAFAATAVLGILQPRSARAQQQWVGIGAVAGTAMFMDTTTIVRAGSIRKAWIRSVDSAPRKFVAGKDTLTFDTVVALNQFDCTRATRTVVAVQYLLDGDIVLDVPETHDTPAPVRRGSFFGAVSNGLCVDTP